jgi:hypothetical protein
MTTPETQRLVFESFGLVGEVLTDDPVMFDAIPAALPPGWQPTGAEPMATFGLMRQGVILLDGSEANRETEPRDALLRLASVIRHRLAEISPTHVFIHAGVVRVGDHGLLLPGSTHSGKTTLVAELVRGGAEYYSDEYAVIDSDGLVHPFAKPLSIRPPGGGGFGAPTPVHAEQIGTAPMRPALVAVTRYRPEALWWPAEGASAQGALELLGHAVGARRRPAAALSAVTQVCRDAQILVGPRGEAGETAQKLFKTLDSSQWVK